MRKFMALPTAGLLVLAVAAPALAGPNVSNTSGSGKSIYGEWSGEATSGYAFLGQESGYGGFGDLYQETGVWVLCESGAPAPIEKGEPSAQDTAPGDEVYGFVGSRTYGYVTDLQITFSRRLDSGTATGSVELFTETVDECAGVYGGDPVFETAALDVTVTGVGSLVSFRGNGSYQVPSEFNGHSNYRGMEREAAGSVDAGPIHATFSFGYMSQISWSEHTNS